MKYFILFAMVITLASCARGCTRFEASLQTGNRQYEVIMFSGGDTVFHDKIHTIVNNNKNSDGVYYYKGDTLVEVSGDYILKSIK